VDGNATTSTSANRVFVTPALEAGREFNYDLQAEIIVDNKPVTATKRITVRAGEETRVNFEMAEATVAAK
jgi:uncharacterized protein (TIGR03000 family)